MELHHIGTSTQTPPYCWHTCGQWSVWRGKSRHHYNEVWKC